MVDMHAQILPGVLDGPKTVEESIHLIELAIKEGITDMISTSPTGNSSTDLTVAEIVEKTAEIRREIIKRRLPIRLHCAQKILLDETILSKVKNNEILTLVDSKYILLELPMDHIPVETVTIIHGLLSVNKVPIIAQPERNEAIAEKPNRLAKLVNHGALAQVSAGSVAGYFGKEVQKLAYQLIQSNLIHTYGSVSQCKKRKPFVYNKGLSFLERRKLSDNVDLLLENNARILTNEDFILLEPLGLSSKKWWELIG